MNTITQRLLDVIDSRRQQDPKQSYVASLFHGGDNVLLQKIGEEATEVILAAKDHSKQELIHEIADLYFHCLVLLSSHQISVEEVTLELETRFGI